MGRFRGFIESFNRYLALKTLFSLATGVVIGIWLAVLGVDFALLWGLLAFLLNFVPNIGSIIAAIPAIFLACTLDLPWIYRCERRLRKYLRAKVHGAPAGVIHTGRIPLPGLLGMGFGSRGHGPLCAPHHDRQDCHGEQ